MFGEIKLSVKTPVSHAMYADDSTTRHDYSSTWRCVMFRRRRVFRPT